MFATMIKTLQKRLSQLETQFWLSKNNDLSTEINAIKHVCNVMLEQIALSNGACASNLFTSPKLTADEIVCIRDNIKTPVQLECFFYSVGPCADISCIFNSLGEEFFKTIITNRKDLDRALYWFGDSGNNRFLNCLSLDYLLKLINSTEDFISICNKADDNLIDKLMFYCDYSFLTNEQDELVFKKKMKHLLSFRFEGGSPETHYDFLLTYIHIAKTINNNSVNSLRT